MARDLFALPKPANRPGGATFNNQAGLLGPALGLHHQATNIGHDVVDEADKAGARRTVDDPVIVGQG